MFSTGFFSLSAWETVGARALACLLLLAIPVRAEVINWEPLVEAGGYARARERGVLRLEGRDYVMADGDVITVRFTP